MFYLLYSSKKLVMSILTTKGSFRNFQTSSFVMQNKEICCSSFIILKQIISFFPTGLKVSSVFKYFVENKCDRKQPQYKIDGIRHKWFLFYVRNTRSVVVFQMWASSVFYRVHKKCSTSLNDFSRLR